MRTKFQNILTAVFLIIISDVYAGTNCGDRKPGSLIDGYHTWVIGNSVVFSTPTLNVDADGAPNSYLVDGNGLSYICDGVLAIENGVRVTPDSDPKQWQQKCKSAWAEAKITNNYSNIAIFGFLAGEKNTPIIQGENDPLPGKAYITTTSVHIPNTIEGTQRHEVDATQIPYIVLPQSFIKKYHVHPGDVAIVYRKKTNKYAFAVYADGGKLGEGSVKLHQDIGSNPIVEKNGIKRAKLRIEDSVTTVVFPGNTTHPSTDHQKWYDEIQEMGKKALESFGGFDQLKLCSK